MFSGQKRGGDDVNSGVKRQRNDEPSKVLHVRGLPAYCTEAEIAYIAAPYGAVQKTLILPEKNQAFIQMDSIRTAQELLSGVELNPVQIRTKTVYLQFSSHQELKTNANTQSAGAFAGASLNPDGATAIILISITNVTVPVTLENIHTICSPYGEVQKIITFTKPESGDFQALVQFSTMEAAANARAMLEGKDLFQGCCHIRVNFSKRDALVVRENNHKSRDFTGGQQQSFAAYDPGLQVAMGGMGGMAMGMGGMTPMGGMQAPNMGMPGMGLDYGYGAMGAMGATQMSFPPETQDSGSVLLVNRLHESKVTCDFLFALFGVYGDVLRVKILYNKRHTALVQLSSPAQAELARSHLNDCSVFGQRLLVSSSKHTDVKLPRESEAGSELTKDYTNSPAHRFRRGSNPTKNINAPSAVLHVSNLHDNCTDHELQELFAPLQANPASPVAVEFFKSSRKMAYVRVATVEDGIACLAALHNRLLGGNTMRVSFSPKSPEQVNPFTSSYVPR